jgi:multiple sugar transport system substrate-binding protein
MALWSRGRRFAALAVGLTMAATAACGGTSGGSSGGSAKITVWHGYTDAEATEMNRLAAEWNAAHPNQRVELIFNGGNDGALQKTLASFVSGKTPTVAYEYGSSVTSLARRPQTQNLTSLVRGTPGFDWNDFFPAARGAATVDGKIYGVPALVDNLALVYNKKLFDRAGIAYPNPNWTWTDFQNAARKLTNASAKQFGWAYANDGSEDTVWRFLALLWQAGGDLLTPGNTKAAFDSPAGLAAMQLLHDMSAVDHSVYLDTGNQQYMNLFNAGKIGMLWTGPWDLSTINSDISYGTTILPGKVNHATISGPDNYMIFGRSSVKKAWPFLQWLLSPQVHLQFSLATGDLPLRQSEQKLPGYSDFLKKYPGDAPFVQNLQQNVTKSRPNIPQYPQISQALGYAIQAVLLGKQQPQAALSDAAKQVDQLLKGA